MCINAYENVLIQIKKTYPLVRRGNKKIIKIFFLHLQD